MSFFARTLGGPLETVAWPSAVFGDSAELKETVLSKETDQTAGIAERSHLSWAARLEIDCEVTNSTVWALVVNGLLETSATPSLARRSDHLTAPPHHTIPLRFHDPLPQVLVSD